MDGKAFARQMRYGVLVVLAFAFLMCVWTVVLGVRELSSSVPGGIALIAISMLLLAAVAWRVRFSWERIHQG